MNQNLFKNLLIIVVLIAGLCSGASIKRERGGDFYEALSANTMGKGNIWLRAYGTGFIWDNAKKLRIFPEVEASVGVLDFVQMRIYSRVLSYGYKPGYVAFELKGTLPNNKKLKLWMPGLILTYQKGLLEDFRTSIGGYRNKATGFSPEGFLFEKGYNSIVLANDLDFIALSSYAPFSLYLNTGYKVPVDLEYLKYSQYLFRIGLGFKLEMVDFFVEYSIDAFRNIKKPLIFDDLPAGKKYAVWFSENKWYITQGARLRYPGGLTLGGAVSIRPKTLVSDKGATVEDNNTYIVSRKEGIKGLTDGFSPFYADWKVHGEISFPIRYRQTASELYRNFLIKKNVKKKKVIDIDKRLEDDATETIEDRRKKTLGDVNLD